MFFLSINTNLTIQRRYVTLVNNAMRKPLTTQHGVADLDTEKNCPRPSWREARQLRRHIRASNHQWWCGPQSVSHKTCISYAFSLSHFWNVCKGFTRDPLCYFAKNGNFRHFWKIWYFSFDSCFFLRFFALHLQNAAEYKQQNSSSGYQRKLNL